MGVDDCRHVLEKQNLWISRAEQQLGSQSSLRTYDRGYYQCHYFRTH